MRKPAVLLLVDVQHAFYDGDKIPAVHENDAVLNRILAVLASARANNTPFIFIQHEGPQGHPLEQGTKGWMLHDAMKVADETVIRKTRPDAFQRTDLQDRLETLEATRLVIVGNQTDFCIDTTCRRASSLDYQVTLLSDCHSTWDNEVLKAEQIIAHHNFVLGRQFVDLAKAEDLDWDGL